MPIWLKIFIFVVVGGFGLIIIGGGAAYLWFTKNVDDFKKTGEEAKQEADAFAASHSDQECVSEGVERGSRCIGLMCEAKARAFLRFCLDDATSTPGFCNGVPPPGEIMKSVTWTLARCTKLAPTDAQRCTRLLAAQQEFCSGQ